MHAQFRTLHLWIGILSIIAFLATGQYMDKVHAHLVGMEDGPRMLFRSTHLYILFTGLINLTLGLHRSPYGHSAARNLQALGSVLLLLVPILLTIGFFSEPFLTDFARPFTRPATYLAFGGGIFLLAAHLLNQRHGPSV